MKYMLLMQGPLREYEQAGPQHWAPEDVQAHIEFMTSLNQELAASGELVEARGLAEPAQATIVEVDEHGVPVVTDGPFPETKEFLAGFWILDCASRERVLEIAARISAAPGRGGTPVRIPVEVRQVAAAPDAKA